MVEQFTNNAITTLNGGIASGDTSLVVASATLFPTSGQFRIIIDSEIMLVTSVSGTTFFITRGIENTTAAAHLSGATVEHILTAAALQQFRSDLIAANLFANRPTAGINGRLFFPTDGGPISIDDGTNWRPLVGGRAVGTQPPSTSNFTWVNQGTATALDSNGCILLSSPSTVGTTRRVFYHSKPAVSFVEMSALLTNTGTSAASTDIFPFIGVGLYETATGKFAYFILVTDVSSTSYDNYVNYGTMTNTTTVNSQTNVFSISQAAPLFLRLSVSGSSVTAKYSSDPRSDGTTGWTALSSFAANFTTAYDASCIIIGGENSAAITVNASIQHYRDG